MAVYHATKAYLLVAVRGGPQEARARGVTVTALCPGPTETAFFAAAGMENIPLLKRRAQPGAAACRAGRVAAEWRRGRRVVVPGVSNKPVAFLSRLPRRMRSVLPVTHGADVAALAPKRLPLRRAVANQRHNGYRLGAAG